MRFPSNFLFSLNREIILADLFSIDSVRCHAHRDTIATTTIEKFLAIRGLATGTTTNQKAHARTVVGTRRPVSSAQHYPTHRTRACVASAFSAPRLIRMYAFSLLPSPAVNVGVASVRRFWSVATARSRRARAARCHRCLCEICVRVTRQQQLAVAASDNVYFR